jgi:hypothetical protein
MHGICTPWDSTLGTNPRKTNPELRKLLHHFVFENSRNTIPPNPQRVSKVKLEETGARASVCMYIFTYLRVAWKALLYDEEV